MALGERKRNFLSKLRDVIFSGVVSGHILAWNGTQWSNADPELGFIRKLPSGDSINIITRNAAGKPALSASVAGDSLNRFVLNADGAMSWGSGSAAGDVTLFRPSASVLQVGTGAVPDVLRLTDNLEVNRQSSTQERQVVKITTSMPVATDATRTGRVQFFVGDSAVAEREVLRLDATGTAAEMQLIGNVTAPMNSRVASAATNSLSSRLTADANDRLQIQPGIIRFGDGTSAVDTLISRGAVGQVNFTANTNFGVFISAQNQASITLNRNGSGSTILFQDNGTVPTVGRLSNITANNSLAFQNSTGATTYYEFGSTLFTLRNGIDLVVGTTNGTRIGTATTQRIGFWNATPVVQPAANPDTSGATLAGLETEVNELKALLRSVGLMA